MRRRSLLTPLLLYAVCASLAVWTALSFVTPAPSGSKRNHGRPNSDVLAAAARGNLRSNAQGPGSSGGSWQQPEVGDQQDGNILGFDKNLLIVMASQFPLFVGVGALIPILPLYGQQFGLAQSSVGLLVSSPSVAKLLLNLPMGRLADTQGRQVLMVTGMLVLAIGDVGTGLASALPALVVARLVTGAGLSISDAGTQAWVADATESKQDVRGNFLGVQNAATGLAFVLGPTLGGVAVDKFGMSSIFFIVAAGAVLCAAGFATLPEMRQKMEEEQWKEPVSFFELVESPNQQALAGISSAFYGGAACKLAVIPAIASKNFGASPTEVGQLFSLLAAFGVVGTLAGGRLTQQVGPRAILVTCGAVCACAYIGAALAVEASAREAFVICLSFWALAGAAKSPALQAFAMAVAPADSRGTSLSVPKTVGDLTFLVAPFLLGFSADRLGPAAALAACGAAFAAGTMLFAVMAVQPESTQAAAEPDWRDRLGIRGWLDGDPNDD